VALLNPLRVERRRIEAELADAETHTNVIELQPQAVQRFKENVEQLARILTDRDAVPDLALIGSFRSLVEAVVIQPRKAGEEYEVRIRGHLAALMGVEVSALQAVAGGDSSDSPLHPPARLHHHTATKSRLASKTVVANTRRGVKMIHQYERGSRPAV
jgi:hypothetical protein